MTISSTILCPELQYYYAKFVTGSILNKDRVPYPASFDVALLDNTRSFIRMMFDEEYPHDSYRYLYREELKSSWPQAILRRLSIFPSSGKYYLCDNDDPEICSIDAFQLQPDDFLLLDRLLIYRVDSTSAVINDIIYEELETNLSKLIYIYLDLKINDSYVKYDNTSIISSSTKPLECAYENFIIEQVFNFVADNVVFTEQSSS